MRVAGMAAWKAVDSSGFKRFAHVYDERDPRFDPALAEAWAFDATGLQPGTVYEFQVHAPARVDSGPSIAFSTLAFDEAYRFCKEIIRRWCVPCYAYAAACCV